MLYLASQSPRRRELLTLIGVEHGVLEVDVPEQRQPGEPPADYVSRVAREKAGAGLLAVMAVPGALVLGADTEVVLGDTVYGKPADAADAARMLGLLAGRTHQVITTIALRWEDETIVTASISAVTMRALSAGEIERYVATGEPFDKAGAYAIQGRAAAFVARIEGTYSGVMGLPLYETADALARIGFPVL